MIGNLYTLTYYRKSTNSTLTVTEYVEPGEEFPYLDGWKCFSWALDTSNV